MTTLGADLQAQTLNVACFCFAPSFRVPVILFVVLKTPSWPGILLISTGCLFLLQEKLQEILNLLRKKKKETQVTLTHEKERVILCKVSEGLTFACCIRFCEGKILKGYLVTCEGKKTKQPSPTLRHVVPLLWPASLCLSAGDSQDSSISQPLILYCLTFYNGIDHHLSYIFPSLEW